MDEMSPRNWSGAELALSAHDQAMLGAEGMFAPLPTWLAALPCAGAIISVATGIPHIEHWNPVFSKTLGDMLDRANILEPAWVADCVRAISDFSKSERDSFSFGFERSSPLGMDVFIATLAWIPTLTGKSSSILMTVMDRTGQRRAEENLRRELISDSLTTLPNRVGFFEIIEELLSGDTLPEDSELMVMVVDLMRFGRINESLGAMTGDELILTIASRLCALQGGEIHIARLGGNEFALLAPLANGVTDAARIAEEVEQAISQPVRLGGFQISVDCALGCCINKVASAEADEMIRRAQSAVRTAKHTGRLEIYRPGVLKAAERRFRVESRLREALGTGELNLVYQPLVDLESGSVTGFEALTRWNDAELGTVYPGEFIEVAEDSGLIVQLGRWSLNEAMQQLARWDNELGEIAPLKMNVNVSPIQMVRDDVVSVVASALRLSGVEGRRLTLELTESAIVDDPDSCRSLLFALKALNVSIAMDDFGTGFSNMASLQSLPIDVLKIDQSFIIEMLNDPDKLAITRAIQSLAQALKLKTTAEGVETAELVSALRDMGCTYGQGYHYAKPMPPKDAFAYWLASRK